ncbi:hypothetical protein [Staphylococcus hominis]|uniref:hypothetical protein n=1 Tax=Staphylococcus hominis TaxID=1290 RepID=UPI00211E1AA0|nr:hypothetical protein [Staphylococcus hominis]
MKFIKDALLNIVSQSLFLAVMQLLLFPHLEKSVGQNQFGEFLLYYAIFNVTSVTLANSFTNLYQKKYNTYKNLSESKLNYYIFMKSMILYFSIFALLLCMLLIVVNITILEFVTLLFLILFTAIRTFMLVWYRVNKEFGRILVINIILSILYLCMIFLKIDSILNILISFSFVELMIIILIGSIIKIDLKTVFKINIKNISFKSINILMVSGFASSLMNYLDRFIINFLLSSGSIAVFYIASLPTKMMLLPFNMLSSVILSYIAETDKINRKIKKQVIMLLPIIFFIVTMSSYFVGLVFIKYTYPNYLSLIQNIYIIVTLSFGLICLEFILRSFLLKYYSIKVKALLDVSTLILFMLLSIIFVNIESNLIAIAYAQLISYAIKLLIEIIIFSKLKVSSN